MPPWLPQILAMLGMGLFGRGGDKASKESEAMLQIQRGLLTQLRPLMVEQAHMQRLQNLRQMALTDPRTFHTLRSAGDLEGLGAIPDVGAGGVPLQEATVNLAYGLLPRFARSVEGGLFAGTPQLQALYAAMPRTRYGRFGFKKPGGSGDTVPKFVTTMPFAKWTPRKSSSGGGKGGGKYDPDENDYPPGGPGKRDDGLPGGPGRR